MVRTDRRTLHLDLGLCLVADADVSDTRRTGARDAVISCEQVERLAFLGPLPIGETLAHAVEFATAWWH